MFRRIWKHLALLGGLIFINVMMFIYMDADGARYFIEHEAPLYPMPLVPFLGAVVSLVLAIGLIVGIVQIMRRPLKSGIERPARCGLANPVPRSWRANFHSGSSRDRLK